MSNGTVAGPLTLLQAAEVAQWYETIAPDITRWIQAKGRVSAREAEDIVQDTFVRVIQHAPQLAGFSAQQRRNYVFTIAANLTRNGMRRWGRRAGAPVELGGLGDDHEDIPCDPSEAEAEWLAHAQPYAQPEQTTAARLTLRAVWESTPHEYRELLLLVAHEYSAPEMAARLGISIQAVATRIWRMRRALLEVGGKIA